MKKIYFSENFPCHVSLLKLLKHRRAFDSRWPCRKSKFVSRGWLVDNSLIYFVVSRNFFKQLFYLSNLKTPWFRKQTHALATDSSYIVKVTDFASRGRKLILIIELELYMKLREYFKGNKSQSKPFNSVWKIKQMWCAVNGQAIILKAQNVLSLWKFNFNVELTL